jgi:glycosyltransferase involved in cell wall biosynthesis
MNIMQIVSGAGINGAVMHTLLLSRELARRGHRITLVCRPGAWIARQLGGEAVEVVESDLRRWPPTELRRLAAVACDRRIDVVHTHMSRAHFFGVLLRWWSGVPCVATAHSQHFQLHWMFNDGVIAVSAATGRYQRTHNLVCRRRLDVIHNFVDDRRFTGVRTEARAAVRAELGIEASTPLIGTVASSEPRKGLVHLVRSLPLILAEVPRARLLVVGDGAGTHALALRSVAARLGVAASIVWAGQRTDVPEILAALDVFALPSVAEALARSALEAMASGLPVVATSVGGMPEAVRDGVTGLLVPPADSKALATAIVCLLRDPGLRRSLGDRARREVRERFSLDAQVPSIEAALARHVFECPAPAVR